MSESAGEPLGAVTDAAGGADGAGPPGAGGEHFVGDLGLDMWHEDGRTRARTTIRPEMWAPGTRRPRVGLLFTMADVVGGSPPTGPITPTIDLRLQLLGPVPSEGDILMDARPLKVGRRLWTGEVLFRADGESESFARSEFSFMNQTVASISDWDPLRVGDRPARRPFPAASFDELFLMRIGDDGSVEIDPHEAVRNGVVGTIQGGVQATMAEVAAERALAAHGDYAVTDLQVRYLSGLKTGPAVARAEVLSRDLLAPVVAVSIADKGNGDRPVSTAIAVLRPSR